MAIDLITEEDLMQTKQANLEAKAELDNIPNITERVQSIRDEEEWIEIPQLPSGYKPYPKGSKFAYRKYTYQEILRVNNADLTNTQRYKVMLSGIKSVGTVEVNPLLITFKDFIFISVVRKLESFGTAKFKLPYTCPYCDNKDYADFKLSDLEFNELDVPKLPAKVRFSQFPEEEFIFSPFTIGDSLWLMENDLLYLKDTEGQYLTNSLGEYVYDDIAFMARQCINKTFEETYKALNSLTDFADIQILEELQQKFEHGPKPYSFHCQGKVEKELPKDFDTYDEKKKERYLKAQEMFGSKCNEKLSVAIGGDTLIIPFRESAKSSTTGIFFD